jgi:serine/threonine-protein kinase
VHRDVSPQNILVGTDGMARVADFGVAKFARKNMASTSDGSLKGKLAYMAPEYLRGEAIDRRFDLYAMGIVLWEALVGVRCFRADNEAETLQRLLSYQPEPISRRVPTIGPALDAILACALAKPRDERFLNAAAMGAALESAAGGAGLLAGHAEVAATVRALVGEAIDARRALVRAKLANEPSVASLMGVPELVQKRVADAVGGAPAAAAREDAPPPTLPLPQLGRAGSAPELGAATRPLGAAVGGAAGTLPMTPRVEDAQLLGGANGAREPARPPSVRTHTSEVSGTGSAAVARGYSAEYTHHDRSARAPERRWVLPVVVGVVTAVVAAAAIRYGVATLSAREGAPATATSAVASTSGTASAAAGAASAAALSAGASAAAGASSAGAASAAASSAGAPASAVGVRSSGRVVHPAAPSASARRPPPNPYATPE